MHIPEDIINRITIPTNPEDKFVYHSERLTVAALTQTYEYMIENGLEYSKLSTGETDVFLQIREDEPRTLYYHLAEPKIEAEVEVQDEADILLCRTAVSQTLTFCLMALNSKPHNYKWRNHALETTYRTVIDHENILRQMPAKEKALTPPPSVFHAQIHPFKRSPIKLRPRKARESCSSIDIIVHKDPQSPSGSSDETSDVETPSKPKARTRQSSIGQTRSAKTSQAAKSDVRHRQYCTQTCLLGLVRRRPLDDACLNINAHRDHGASNHHALEQKSLVKLMSHQLAQDPDNGCEPLGKQGARSALFRLTLESYGYTFVAKGTVTAFKAKLNHEGLVYRHLNEVQGVLIPVYLGNISLVNPFFLDVGVRIVHMLLMSWAGEQARKDLMQAMGRDLIVEMSRTVTKLLDCRVEHGDVRPPNVLWNSEIKNVMLVDFERSEILKQVLVLQETSPNQKRKHLHFSSKGSRQNLSNELSITS